MNQLIAESGSTKTLWIIAEKGKEVNRFTTSGINPFYTSSEEIFNTLKNEIPEYASAVQVDEVNFYGAGCSLPERCSRVELALSRIWPNAKMTIQHDLLAAARGALVRKPGVVAILGTGSNSAQYDGERIVKNVKSLGFPLGDEGSGGDIGRRFLKMFYYGWLNSELSAKVREEMGMDPDEYHSRLFEMKYMNREVARWTRFIALYGNDEVIEKTVVESLKAFFEGQIMRYRKGDEMLQCSAIGGVAKAFEMQLRNVAQIYGVEILQCMDSPTEGLLRFHGVVK